MQWDNKQDRAAFLERFMGLCELFSKETNEFNTKVYFRALSRFDVQDVVRGVDKAIVRCKFFPKPVELIELIEGSPEDAAEVEASKVWTAITRVGAYRSVVFDNAVTAAVVEQGFGGWVKLCSEMRAEDEKWFRKDFCKTYASFSRQNVRHFGELAGRTAIANEAHFKPHKEQIALIGDAGKAQAALVAGQGRKGTEITMLVEGIGQNMLTSESRA